jgi:predicted DsbA family dithiol-disulfide isomerase
VRLDQLEERMGDAISIVWKSFLLRPEPQTPDQAKFVEYTKSWLRPAEMEPATEFRVWATDNLQPTSSVPPHLAAKALELIAPESGRAFHRRLLSAYFTENRTISDWDVLYTLAEDVGVEGIALGAVVEEQGSALTQTVIDEHNEALSNGINAVPTTLIAGVLPVAGAQDVDTFERWITRLIDNQSADATG